MFTKENELNFTILINQHMLNDLVRDLVLSKEKAGVLSSRLNNGIFLKQALKLSFIANEKMSYLRFHH